MGDLVQTGTWVALAYVGLRLLVRFGQLGTFTRYVDRHRRFSTSDHRRIVRRAGFRCEHHSLILRRCRATMPLEADHVHPWSKGGQTAVANGQALCSWHNTLKWAWVPTMVQVWRLERRRLAYFPDGEDVHVQRHGSRASLVRRGRTRRRRRSRSRSRLF